MGQTALSLIQIFPKMLQTEIKHELLKEIYEEFLRRQHGSMTVLSFEDW